MIFRSLRDANRFRRRGGLERNPGKTEWTVRRGSRQQGKVVGKSRRSVDGYHRSSELGEGP
jgi:hypothetical protein